MRSQLYEVKELLPDKPAGCTAMVTPLVSPPKGFGLAVQLMEEARF